MYFFRYRITELCDSKTWISRHVEACISTDGHFNVSNIMLDIIIIIIYKHIITKLTELLARPNFMLMIPAFICGNVLQAS